MALIPISSAARAERKRVVPEEVVRRLRGVTPEQQRQEGKRLCVEIIQQVREIEGVSGVHVMAYRQEELVAEIIEEAGLLPRRRLRPGGPLPVQEASPEWKPS